MLQAIALYKVTKVLSLVILLNLVNCIAAHAQKLPEVQQSNLRAPSNVKVDGSSTEWGNKFEAYNHATGIYYTMANDDENLYLVVQVLDLNVVDRIWLKGISFSIQRGASKDDENQASITYPTVKNPPYFGLNRKKYANNDVSIKARDSVMRHYNKMIDTGFRFIRVKGIAGIDTLISIYNRDGIKVRGQFDNKKVFTCEFAIRLQLVNISINDNEKFGYHIRINDLNGIVHIARPSNPTAEQEVDYERMNQLLNNVTAATYFQGEYTLAKK